MTGRRIRISNSKQGNNQFATTYTTYKKNIYIYTRQNFILNPKRDFV